MTHRPEADKPPATGASVPTLPLLPRRRRGRGATFTLDIVFKDEVHTRGGPPFTMVETISRRRQ